MTTTLFFRHAWLPNGWARNVRIEIAAGLITAVTPNSAPETTPHGIALPGMPNLHSHSFQRAIAGLTEHRAGTDNFWSWRDLMYRFALTMSPDDVEAIATMAFIDMLQGGFTTAAEFHYLHHAPDGTPYANIAEMAERLAAAAATAGIDLLLLPVFYAHANFGGQPPLESQRRFINSLNAYEDIFTACEKLAPTGIAPHSLRAVTPDELSHLTCLAGPRPVHIHIAEQTGEVNDCLAWSGARPIEFLLNHAPVAPNWCLVHATHATPAELAALAKTDAVAGLCPITEANLGDGIFPMEHFTGPYGIGSDSNVLIDAFQELRSLEYSQRLAQRQRNLAATATQRHTATALYTNALAGGAQAMGITASLTQGAAANIIALPAADNPDTALAQALFTTRQVNPTVWVRGQQTVTNGHHPLAETARTKFNAAVVRLTH